MEGHGAAAAVEGLNIGTTLLSIAVILLAAKLSSLVDRFGQPAVLGEMLVGVLLGNLALIGVTLFEPIKANEQIAFLAELGVIVLLFQVGLESNVRDMSRVGRSAFLVACVGVALPMFLASYLLGPLLLPGLSTNTYLFLGATLSATSVGITARVFRDLGALQSREAQIVLGAAVIDDVLGLIILAVVSALVTVGTVSLVDVGRIIGIAVFFLGGSILIGQLMAGRLGGLLARINTGQGMKLTLALVCCLGVAYLAQAVGLAPIVGAFAAGLILDAVHFRSFDPPLAMAEVRAAVAGADSATRAAVGRVIDHHTERHVEDLVEPVGTLLAPLFFVLTGMHVTLSSLLDPQLVLLALGLTAIALAGKLATGLVAGRVNRWVVGWGMVPRGEVGLIFAAAGRQLGVIDDRLFSVIVIVVMLTTLVTPPVLSWLVRRSARADVVAAAG